jgi:hypothetical protein
MRSANVMASIKFVIGDSKSPHTRWAGINGLGDARLLLNCLFTKLINCETDLAARNERVVELEVNLSNVNTWIQTHVISIIELQMEKNLLHPEKKKS